ncbi:MAG: tRNA uridine-5-carboxymethylaminomethyl(34) synthesis GTPase MnmE [Calditrichaeota bacterium]|nr:MAG: tRNA uridine-5-carboxymethylaminomethyl(34) synthesis GTPase MnmE [Calditrichota bacterium]
MNTSDSIVALATPPGIGAIAIVRLSGKDCFQLFSKISTVQPKKLKHKSLLLIKLYQRTNNNLIDECVVISYHAPNSYTGENLIEICAHGSQLIPQLIIQALIENGARLARPGEFTERAFLNGKIDLVQAESVDALIRAATQSELSLVQNQYSGAFSDSIKKVRDLLIELLSLLELELDFSDEDVEFASRDQLTELLDRTEKTLDILSQSYKRSHIIRGGFDVVITGKPNVGKSSLLNLILKKERAIVTDIAGTTRDILTEQVDIAGYKFNFSDTAGIHRTTDPVEIEGIKRSSSAAQNAELILMMIDGSQKLTKDDWNLREQLVTFSKNEQIKVIILVNKIDILDMSNDAEIQKFLQDVEYLTLSCLTGIGFRKLESVLIEKVKISTRKAIQFAGAIMNDRQKNIITNAHGAINNANRNFQKGLTQEFISSDIRHAVHYLSELTGDITTDEILSNIFSKFCIGK